MPRIVSVPPSPPLQRGPSDIRRGRSRSVAAARAVLAALAALLVAAGCSDSTRPAAVNAACTVPAEAYVRALRGAPDRVVLDGGTRLSECIGGAQTPADVQNIGVTLTEAAERLEARAPRDPRAALRLGYLVGAARRGAQSQLGVIDELLRRIERSADLLDPSPAAARALERGIAAGEARG